MNKSLPFKSKSSKGLFQQPVQKSTTSSIIVPPQVPPRKPQKGSIVTVVWPNDENRQQNGNEAESPAIIVSVDQTPEGVACGKINLRAFSNGRYIPWFSGARYSEGNEPGTWHFIS